MDWVGLTVEQFSIDAQIGEGSFAWIFKGVSASGEQRAFKVSKPRDFVLRGMRTGAICTKALKFRTNGVTETVPDAQELLNLEYEKFSQRKLSCLPNYYGIASSDNLTYLQMEYLQGETLQSMIDSGRADISSVQKAAVSLSKLLSSGLPYHGDLNAENIFIERDDVKLLDPGHFGELRLADGSFAGVMVTTPQYYPLFKPDDVLALGLIAWQIVLGNPLIERELRDSASKGRALETNLAGETLEWLQSLEIVGNFYVSALRSMPLPSRVKAEITDQQEAVLLRALRLGLNEQGKIVRSEGYASASDLAVALNVFRA